jgi:hypothetical protein
VCLINSYHIRILPEDFNAKVGREYNFRVTIGNETSHEISNDNGLRLVTIVTSKNLKVKSTIFLIRNNHFDVSR